MTAKRIAVLMGGYSKEREVSLVSGKAASKALRARGFDVREIDVPRDVSKLVTAIQAAQPDVVFNALHGRFGEDGCIQGLLDIMALPYTASGRMASAVAMDKPMAKRVFASAGIPVAAEKVVTLREAKRGDVLPRPYVLKPTNEGSSVGVKIVRAGSNHPPLDDLDLGDDDLIMAEAFIPGREVTVGSWAIAPWQSPRSPQPTTSTITTQSIPTADRSTSSRRRCQRTSPRKRWNCPCLRTERWAAAAPAVRTSVSTATSW